MSHRPTGTCRISLTLLTLALTLASCSGAGGVLPVGRAYTPTFTPFQPLLPTPLPGSAAASPSPPPVTPPPPNPEGVSLWVDPSLPAALRASLALPPEMASASQAEGAQLRLEAGGGQPIGRWVYALVTPFPTIPDEVSSQQLRGAWQGESGGPFSGRPLLLAEETLDALSTYWGAPAEGAVQTLPADELLGYAWGHRPAWGIVPFEALRPRWKVLAVDGQSPIHKDFDPAAYALSLPISLGGDPALAEAVAALYGPGTANPLLPAGNRDAEKLTTVALTGVTALVRATAYTMNQQGVTYPGQDVGPWLREADITHISNEVPFARDCPPPDPVQRTLRFCSDPSYIRLLEDVGADVVELSGDHFADWGPEAMYYTLELYDQHGLPYYGGGANLQEGRQPFTVEHNGNRLAFLGCNAKGPGFATASDTQPGAALCDLSWLESQVAQLRAEGYLVIATFQHFEYYSYDTTFVQRREFDAAAEAGASVASGSQAHQPQAMAFVGEAFVHYGLGNLFFDQYDISSATRQAFIDRHVFYDGRHISTELLTIVFVDYARPRPMTPAERQELLQTVFAASDW